MPVLQDRVQETTTTGGTGTLTLAGAVTGYRSFAQAFSIGDITYYTIDNGSGEWEIGVGTVGSGTLSRNSVLESSNANALVNFGSGTKRVFCSAPTKVLLPNETGNSGKLLTTDGVDPAWTSTVNGLTIGNVTPGSGAFTTLSASSTVSGTGFSTYLASPPAIGGTTPAAGNFTTLGATGNVTLGDANTDTLTINGTAVACPNNLNFDSNTLFIDAANNAVGIGTNTPANRLSVLSTVNPAALFQATSAASAGIEIRDGAATPNRWWLLSGLGSTTDGIFSIYDARQSASRLAINTLGNVGVGTSTPGSRLTVLSATNNGIAVNDGTINTIVYNSSSGTGSIGTTTNHPLALYTNNVERMRIDSSGNVGIGTSSPSSFGLLAIQKTTPLDIGPIFSLNNPAGGGSAIVFNNSTFTQPEIAKIWTVDDGLYSCTLRFGTKVTGATGNVLAERMRIDSSGNVGIGTTSPTAKFDVAGTIRATAQVVPTSGSGLELIGGPATNYLIAYNRTTPGFLPLVIQASTLSLFGSSTTGLTVDSSGNVGIGTSSPGAKLDINANAATTYARNGDYTNGASSGSIPIFEALGARNDSNNTFYSRYGASYRRCDGTAISAVQRLGVYAFGGQWGTDTSYQSSKLLYTAGIFGVAEGSFTSATAMPTALVFSTGSTGNALSSVNVSYGTERMRIDSSGQCIWKPNGTTSAMTLDASGNLNLGTTGVTTFRSAVYQSSNLGNLLLFNTLSSGFTYDQFQVQTIVAGSSAFYFARFYAAGTPQFAVRGDGVIFAQNTTVQAISSDVRLKQNIVDFDKGLNEILGLRPRYFEYKNNPGVVASGFIAQEVEEAIPGSIEPIRDDPEHFTYRMDWNPLLVKAIQELHAEIELLKAKVN